MRTFNALYVVFPSIWGRISTAQVKKLVLQASPLDFEIAPGGKTPWVSR